MNKDLTDRLSRQLMEDIILDGEKDDDDEVTACIEGCYGSPDSKEGKRIDGFDREMSSDELH